MYIIYIYIFVEVCAGKRTGSVQITRPKPCLEQVHVTSCRPWYGFSLLQVTEGWSGSSVLAVTTLFFRTCPIWKMWFKHVQTCSKQTYPLVLKPFAHMAMENAGFIGWFSLFTTWDDSGSYHRLPVLQADLRQIVAWAGRPPSQLRLGILRFVWIRGFHDWKVRFTKVDLKRISLSGSQRGNYRLKVAKPSFDWHIAFQNKQLKSNQWSDELRASMTWMSKSPDFKEDWGVPSNPIGLWDPMATIIVIFTMFFYAFSWPQISHLSPSKWRCF